MVNISWITRKELSTFIHFEEDILRIRSIFYSLDTGANMKLNITASIICIGLALICAFFFPNHIDLQHTLSRLSTRLKNLGIWHSVNQPGDDPTSCEAYNTIRCANGGLLEKTENGYACKCPPNYYGETCTEATFWTNAKDFINRFGPKSWNERRGTPKSWWIFKPSVSNTGLLRVYEFHQNQVKRLKMFTNDSRGEPGLQGTRILPPARPSGCLPDIPLPPLDSLSGDLFRRKSDGFKSSPDNRTILYHSFYQHFMLQYFNTDFNMTVTASQLYGAHGLAEAEVRTFCHGKLKTDILDDESGHNTSGSITKLVKFIKRTVTEKIRRWSDNKVKKSRSRWFNEITSQADRSNVNFPMGRQWSKTSHVHFTMSSLWVREHNRVCDLLIRKWPQWTDGQIYTTARRIITGEMMTIMMNDIMDVHVGHSYPTRLEPDMFRYVDRRESSLVYRTPFELFLTTMWPTDFRHKQVSAMLANDERCDDTCCNRDRVVKFMVENKMGAITHNNENVMTKPWAEFLMKLSRDHSVQSFNNYRRHLNLPAYKSFSELTGNVETAAALQKLYGNVENVELLSGILTEKTTDSVSQTLAVMTNSFVINSILTNPLTSMWEPDTFGGDEGFEIVRSASIHTFVCNNLRGGKCSDDFKVKLYTE